MGLIKRLFPNWHKCPRCGDWHHKSVFRSEWCLTCEWRQRDVALAHVGWMYLLSLHPDDAEMPRYSRADFQENYDIAVGAARALPKDARFRAHILDTLVALGDKLGLDTSKVVW